jgi:hypothetical protein
MHKNMRIGFVFAVLAAWCVAARAGAPQPFSDELALDWRWTQFCYDQKYLVPALCAKRLQYHLVACKVILAKSQCRAV